MAKRKISLIFALFFALGLGMHFHLPELDSPTGAFHSAETDSSHSNSWLTENLKDILSSLPDDVSGAGIADSNAVKPTSNGVILANFTQSISFSSGNWSEPHANGPDCSTISLKGHGTEESPYVVSNDWELQCIRAVNQNDYGAKYEIVKNINASLMHKWEYSNYSAGSDMGASGRGFYIIGKGGLYPLSSSVVIDGQGHVVKNFYSNSSQYGAGGFIGESDATIKNLGFVNTTVVNQDSDVYQLGSVVKSNQGSLENVFSTGEVIYKGNAPVGGLVGSNDGTLNRTYAAVTVKGNPTTPGGLVAKNMTGTVISSYWDIDVSNQSTSAGGTGLTTSEMQGSSAESNMVGFDFSSEWLTVSDGYPRINQSSLTSENDLPYLPRPIDGAKVVSHEPKLKVNTTDDGFTGNVNVSFYNASDDTLIDKQTVSSGNSASVTWNNLSKDTEYNWYVEVSSQEGNKTSATWKFRTHPFAGGEGTSSSPYEIKNCLQLQKINAETSASYRLLNDIDCSSTSTWNSGKGFKPIGGFSGTLNGENYTISNLKIDRPSSNNVGLIGHTGNYPATAEIMNLHLKDVDITGGDNYVGSLVGQFQIGKIENISSTGTVSGGGNVGGLLGSVGSARDPSLSKVKMVSSTVNVSGSTYVGGLVGMNDGIVQNTYARGSVDGSTEVGGLIGLQHTGGDVSTSYSTGTVTGSSYTGGLVGKSWGSGQNSYWNTQSSGQSSSAVGTGLSTSEMQGSSAEGNMTGFDFTNVWKTVSGGYPKLRWQN